MKEETLTLRHLSGYLPYGLKIFIPDGKGIGTLDCLSTDGIISEFAFGIKERIGLHNPVQWKIKPLLIPLSELTYADLEATFCGSKRRLRNMALLGACNYKQWEYLVSKHFDVFNLLESGLALNKNTHGK